MRYLTQTIRSLGVTFRNLFRAPTTEYFGRPEHDKGERFRTSFALLYEDQVRNEAGDLEAGRGDELCIACKKCEMICPSFIISVVPGEKRQSALTGKKRGYLEDFTLDMNACIFCELCVQVCPVDAIVMCRESTKPAFHREDLVLTMDKLYRNGDDKPLSWGTGTKLVDMQDPSRLSPEQEAAKQAKIAEMEAKQAEEPDGAREEATS